MCSSDFFSPASKLHSVTSHKPIHLFRSPSLINPSLTSSHLKLTLLHPRLRFTLNGYYNPISPLSLLSFRSIAGQPAVEQGVLGVSAGGVRCGRLLHRVDDPIGHHHGRKDPSQGRCHGAFRPEIVEVCPRILLEGEK